MLRLMTTRARVYTPAPLAAEWKCSAHQIRNLIDNGELRAFRLGGKLLRIPVERDRIVISGQPGDRPQERESFVGGLRV